MQPWLGTGQLWDMDKGSSVALGVLWLASLASLVSLSLKHNVRSLNWLEWAFCGRWNSRSTLLLDSLSSLLSLEPSSSSQTLSAVKRESFTFMLVIVGKVAFFILAFMLKGTCDIKKKFGAWSSLDKRSDLNLAANQKNIAVEFMLFTLGKSESENVSRWVVFDSATPCTVAGQAPLSMRFSRRDYRSGLPCPPLGDLPVPRIEPVSPASPAS